MAPVLVSIEWPGLTYLLKGRLEEFEYNGHQWNRFGILDWLSQELCCYLRPRRVKTVGVFAEDSLEGTHLRVFGTIGLVCRVLLGFCVHLKHVFTLRERSVCGQPCLVKSNRREVVSDIWRRLRELLTSREAVETKQRGSIFFGHQQQWIQLQAWSIANISPVE